MKNRILVPLLSVTCLSVLLFSCSSSRYASYQKKSGGYSLNKQLNDKKNPQNIFNGGGEIPEEKVAEAVVVNEVTAEPATVAAPVEVIFAPVTATQNAGTEVKEVLVNAPAKNVQAIPGMKNQWLARKMSKAIVKAAEEKAMQPLKENASRRDVPLIIEFILAIFIPPLAVLLHKGELTGGFFLNILLTILFWLPGIIHAMLIIFDVV